MTTPIELQLPEFSILFDILPGGGFPPYPDTPLRGDRGSNGISEPIRYPGFGATLNFRPFFLEIKNFILFSPNVTASFVRHDPWMRREEGGDLEGIFGLKFQALDIGAGGFTGVRDEAFYFGFTYDFMGSSYFAAAPEPCPPERVNNYGNCEGERTLEEIGGIPVSVHDPLRPEEGPAPHFSARLGLLTSIELVGQERGLRLHLAGGAIFRNIRVVDNPDRDRVDFVTAYFALGLGCDF